MAENLNQPQPESAEGEVLAEEDVQAESLDVQALQQELQDWQGKANEYLDGWQRARAEFANYKKRMEREQAQVHQNAAAGVLKRYLDVLDDLERALKNRPEQGEGAAWASGIELIYRKLGSLLEAEGLERIQAEGELFDPTQHEAISHEPNQSFESGQIIEVVKQGYRLGERVIRPALVRVAQ